MKSHIYKSAFIYLASGISMLLAGRGECAGAAPQPGICTRACWGARSASGITYMSALTRAIVHHTAGGEYNTTGFEASKANVRAIQNLHINNGWGDIGYHFLVDKFGNIFEGRFNSMGSLPRGAHDGTNTNSFGFNIMGYFHAPNNNQPTAAMLNSLYNVIAWRMPNGWTPYGSPGVYGPLGNSVGRLDAHRRVNATACPGDLVFNPYMGSDMNSGVMRAEVNARISPPAQNYGPKPSLLVKPDGRMIVFMLGTDGSIWHRWQTIAGGTWSNWASLGGLGFTKVKAIYDPVNDVLAYCGIGTGGPMYHRWQFPGGLWSDWLNFGGTWNDFDYIRTPDGSTALGAVATNGSVMCKYQLSAGGLWTDWINLGGAGFSNVSMHARDDNALSVLGHGPGSPLWQWEQPSLHAAFPVNARNCGGQVWQIDTVRSSIGLPIVFATGASGSLTHSWQQTANGNWNAWVGLGGTGFNRIDAVSKTQEGILVLFGFGDSGTVYHKWQTSPGSAWSDFAAFEGTVGSLAAEVHPSGGILMFGRGRNDQTLWHKWQTVSGGPWSAWADMGCCFQ